MLALFSSMTRVTLLLMVLTLCGLVIFSDIKGNNFDTVFKVFSDLILMVASFFFGKSATQATSTPTNTTTPTPVSPDTLPG